MGIEISLEGQRALVTGASQGIGEGIAKILAQAGAAVALCARRERELSDLAAKIESRGGRAVPVSADLTDRSAAERVVQSAVDALGGLDILVNNAGVSERVRPHEVTDEDIDMAIDLKFRAGVRLSRICLPHLKERPGCIVNIAGHSGVEAASKNAMGGIGNSSIISFTKSLSDSVAQWGVRVNVVSPGVIITPRADRNDRRMAEMEGITFEESRARQIAAVPLGRGGSPDDVAHAVAFLASGLAGHITGANLLVDGGACRAAPY
jgi:NAD(P)-dependent dehydrogenase (short-subunit alcohol dehydrogenase family)